MATQDYLPIGRLGMKSVISTAAQTGRHTFKQGRLVLKQRELGSGGFAVVALCWDVSTGIGYACKAPRDPEKFRREYWEREMDIMSQTRHTKTKKQRFSYDETLMILRQTLSALQYLHEHKPLIVHRDIKPRNILVLSRNHLHVKLADFGLAKTGDALQTICGTQRYLPPEIANRRRKYTEAVDIWSLGVVILKFAHGFPNLRRGNGTDWCERLVEEVNTYKEDRLMNFLSTGMLIMDHRRRYSAQACLGRVEGLVTCAGGDEAAVVPRHPDQGLARPRPSSLGDIDSPIPTWMIQSNLRTLLPRPPTPVSRKRPISTAESSPPSTPRPLKHRKEKVSSPMHPEDDEFK
ncbi:CAMK protein kinase [Polytolypa hystricis UAMH7299]|uniref:CAMK protein kinase n=1 Tax=Polytolypa hystricis (strain UAMH7299) TaxID=1447883 RepID=A0A2B7YAI5_POLH7|nr:CAMK protein kinase [Polytolypa hystricis UAMH7299]